jgi:hypothetical protein
MKSKVLMMSALAVAMLGTVWAQAPAAKPAKKAHAASSTASPKMHTRFATGSIVSVDDSKLVLSHKGKGKTEEMTFSLNASTQRQGKLQSGSKATVHYTTEGSDMVATTVKASS